MSAPSEADGRAAANAGDRREIRARPDAAPADGFPPPRSKRVDAVAGMQAGHPAADAR